MSRSRRRKSKEDSQRIKSLYSEFVDHIRDSRDDKNPSLGVNGDYKVTYGYLLVTLKNVAVGTSDLYDHVRSFCDGTILESKEDPMDGPTAYQVKIPLDGSNESDDDDYYDDHRHSRRGSPKKPEVTTLMGYVMLAMVVLIGATVTTTSDDWTFLTSW